jgi:GT2 family glycosyltransferase/glycosyltransferase involved in cell wall biosynthesis
MEVVINQKEIGTFSSKHLSPIVYVILVNWNETKSTLECLKYLSKVSYDNCRIVVVDNDSKERVADHMKDAYSHVQVIENDSNLGFAEGCNVGARYACEQGADFLFFLNNDTIVDSEVVIYLLDALHADPSLCLVGPKVLNYYAPDMLESAGGKISFKLSQSFAIGYGQKDEGQYDLDKSVDFISGSSFMVRAEVFQKVNFFDKSYFAYYEDMDICCQLKQLNYRLGYVHRGKVWKKVSATTGDDKNPEGLFWSTRNRFMFVHRRGTKVDIACFWIYFFFFYLLVFCTINIVKGHFQNIKALMCGLASLVWHEIHYSKEFPFNIKVDCFSMMKSKGGVGYYNAGLVKGLKNVNTRHILGRFDYAKEATNTIVLVKILRKIFLEQIFLPLQIMIKRVDLVHYPAFISPVWKTSKTVITIHDMSYLLFPEMFLWQYRMYLRLFVPFSAKRADQIIADSDNTKRDIVRLLGIPEEKVKVVYPGTNLAYSCIEDTQRIQDSLKTLAIQGEYILSVGTLEPRKNIKTLIKAYAHLMQDSPVEEISLVIVGGKGWLYEEIFREVERVSLKTKIIFTGYVTEEEMICLYNGAKIFVYPSLYEGFGLPPLEAMACGVPVIVSNVSSLPEVVGDAALMFSPESFVELKDKIQELLNDQALSEDLILRGKERVKQFTWEKAAKQTMQVYEESLKKI